MTQNSTIAEFKPILTANFNSKIWVQFLLLLEFCVTITILLLINFPIYRFMFQNPWLLLFIPICIYGLFFLFLLITSILSTIFYKILIKIEPPKEGIFPISGREFKFYYIRFWICYYLIYFARAMPLPWADMFIFPIFGSKIGSNVVLYDSWIDPEFVEIGGSCMISLNTQILSHCIVGDQFIVKKVIIEKNSIAGACAIISPGTYMEEGAVLGANSSTAIDQRLSSYAIHVGMPVNKSFPVKLQQLDKKELIDDQNE